MTHSHSSVATENNMKNVFSIFKYIALNDILTHWGRVTHICVSNKTIIGSDNGLSPGRRQAIIWTNAGILLIRTLRTNFSETLSEIHKFSFKKMHLKMSSGKWRPFCLGLNVLNISFETQHWSLYWLGTIRQRANENREILWPIHSVYDWLCCVDVKLHSILLYVSGSSGKLRIMQILHKPFSWMNMINPTHALYTRTYRDNETMQNKCDIQ